MIIRYLYKFFFTILLNLEDAWSFLSFQSDVGIYEIYIDVSCVLPCDLSRRYSFQGKVWVQIFQQCISHRMCGDWDGNRDVLDLYINSGGAEDAKNWGIVLEDLKSRGLLDILIVCIDNFTGFSEQINEVFPYLVVQNCIVHQVRNSLKYVDEKDRKPVSKTLLDVKLWSVNNNAPLSVNKNTPLMATRVHQK